MKAQKPRFTDDKMFKFLREGNIDEFNKARQLGEKCNLRGTNLRMLDLRRANLEGVDLSDCYFRQSDLRGLNLTDCNLEGASIHGAHISGTYFPFALSAEEIKLSVQFGTRMRYMQRHIND